MIFVHKATKFRERSVTVNQYRVSKLTPTPTPVYLHNSGMPVPLDLDYHPGRSTTTTHVNLASAAVFVDEHKRLRISDYGQRDYVLTKAQLHSMIMALQTLHDSYDDVQYPIELVPHRPKYDVQVRALYRTVQVMMGTSPVFLKSVLDTDFSPASAHFRGPGRSLLLAVETVTDRVVGMVGSVGPASCDRELVRFAVHPDYRRRGIGTRLLQHCLQAPGIVRVSCFHTNAVANAFYRKFLGAPRIEKRVSRTGEHYQLYHYQNK